MSSSLGTYAAQNRPFVKRNLDLYVNIYYLHVISLTKCHIFVQL
jgi:hypothetical protein